MATACYGLAIFLDVNACPACLVMLLVMSLSPSLALLMAMMKLPKPRRSEIDLFIDEGVQAQTIASKWLVNMFFFEIPFILVGVS